MIMVVKLPSEYELGYDIHIQNHNGIAHRSFDFSLQS
jgi:hypothetical protein